MPHITVKLWPGKSEEVKKEAARKIAETLAESLGSNVDACSVSFEEVSKEEWKEQVWDKEIVGKSETLYKKPGYSME